MGILIGFSISLQSVFGSLVTFTIVILPIHEHRIMFFNFLVPFSDFRNLKLSL